MAWCSKYLFVLHMRGFMKESVLKAGGDIQAEQYFTYNLQTCST